MQKWFLLGYIVCIGPIMGNLQIIIIYLLKDLLIKKLKAIQKRRLKPNCFH